MLYAIRVKDEDDAKQVAENVRVGTHYIKDFVECVEFHQNFVGENIINVFPTSQEQYLELTNIPSMDNNWLSEEKKIGLINEDMEILPNSRE